MTRVLTDRRVWLRISGLLLLFICMASALYGQEPPTAPPLQFVANSLADKWLAPDVILTIALALLYVGELRGELKRIKLKIEDFEAFMRDLDTKLETKYMSRELVDSRFREFKRFQDRDN